MFKSQNMFILCEITSNTDIFKGKILLSATISKGHSNILYQFYLNLTTHSITNYSPFGPFSQSMLS